MSPRSALPLSELIEGVDAVAWTRDGSAILLGARTPNAAGPTPAQFFYGRVLKLDATTGVEIGRARVQADAMIVALIPMR